MKLKMRYASSLFIILVIIGIFTWEIASCVRTGNYLTAVVLTVLLYGCTFILGRKFKRVFFLLSTIKLIRELDGVASVHTVRSHIERGSNNSEELTEEIIELLLRENVVDLHNDQLLLTGK